ncbi:hypothetical protein L4D76_04115 [Photobacterium sagamiensis]|uniref:hypothetical protein n=1 Tax=Photobacterium sagamiensis TaxID=2910241 RepID=UPI003D0D9EC4
MTTARKQHICLESTPYYQLAVHIDEENAQALTVKEVIDRWCALHSKPVLIQRLLAGDTNS